MKGFKNKRGISLIVLVITIIVMIILAAAIILSISNSGIMDKANKAKTDSDTANLKEYVNVLEAEWELMSETERAGKTKEAYVNKKLEEKGYTSAYMTSDETLYTNLQANAKEVLKAGITIGDKVEGYTLDSNKTSYTTSGKENNQTTSTSQTVTRIEYTTWKYIGIGENGEILIAPDMVDSVDTNQTIKLTGKGGYFDGPAELDDVCQNLYSTSKGTARSINMEDIYRILDCSPKAAKKLSDLGITTGDTPDGSAMGDYYSDYYLISKTSTETLKTTLTDFVFTAPTYWLANSCVDCNQSNPVYFGVRRAYPGGVDYNFIFISTAGFVGQYDNAVRPVVQINSDVSVSYSNGTLTIN